MDTSSAPDHLYLRQSAQDRPSESQVTASLVFERPPGWPDVVIEFCGLPKSGPVSQMDIEWKLAGQLPEYGELVKDKKGTETDRDGVVDATDIATAAITIIFRIRSPPNPLR